jgi:hypothetical protein
MIAVTPDTITKSHRTLQTAVYAHQSTDARKCKEKLQATENAHGLLRRKLASYR